MLLIFIYAIILIWCIIDISIFGDKMHFASFIIIVTIMLFSIFMIIWFAIIPILLAYKILRLKLDRQSEILSWISFGLSELI